MKNGFYKRGFYVGNGNGFSWISMDTGNEYISEEEQRESEDDSKEILR